MSAQLNFDATQVEPDAGFDIIPAGWYNVAIDESEMKPTKDGAGAYLQLSFKVLDGEYANRKVFSRLNLRNASPVAQEIAYKQLSAIAHAVKVLHVQDSSQLHGIPLKVKVKVRQDKTGEYEDQNEISVYKAVDDAPASAQAVPQAPATPVAPPMPAAAPAAPQAAPVQQAPAPVQAAPAAPPQAPAAPAAPAQEPAAQAQAAVPPWAQPPQQ